MDKIPCPLSQAAKNFGHEPAVIIGRREISYRQLDQCVQSTAKQLKKLGLRKGHRAAIAEPNSLETMVVLFSLWRMGVITVLLNHRLPEAALLRSLQKVGSQVLFTSQKIYMTSTKIPVRKFRPEEVINFDVRQTTDTSGIFIEYQQPLTILFTSGSSSDPKAALHSFGNHYFNALGANENILLGKGDRWLWNLPLFHVSGMGILWRVILAGASLVLLKEAEEDLGQLIQENRITHLSVVSTHLYRLLAARPMTVELSSLKAILVGGGPISPTLIQQAGQARLPLHLTYGLTEMASQVATTAQPLTSSQHEEPARILQYRQVKISSEGEILVKGETLFLGYVEGERVKRPLDEEGWFKTGDLGTMPQAGFLTVTGRKDQMFISGGENIYPEEIEMISAQLPGVLQAIVVPIEDKEFGHIPAAFIQRLSAQALDRKMLTAHLEKNLPKFKIPKIFYEWPGPGLGERLKVQRTVLQQLAKNPEKLKPIA